MKRYDLMIGAFSVMVIILCTVKITLALVG